MMPLLLKKEKRNKMSLLIDTGLEWQISLLIWQKCLFLRMMNMVTDGTRSTVPKQAVSGTKRIKNWLNHPYILANTDFLR